MNQLLIDSDRCTLVENAVLDRGTGQDSHAARYGILCVRLVWKGEKKDKEQAIE